MKQLIECVPNFSEGRNMEVINQIAQVIEKSDGVKLLDVDPGYTTNRTVVTFVGTPDEVVEAAFQVIKKAQELIDMRVHKGDHPRFGATDVCPLVPVSNISMEETAVYAHKLAKRVGEELDIPVFCYENAAREEKRRNLANCRAGEYEALKERIGTPEWKPDFGPSVFSESVAKSGAVAIGARDFLLAVNFNLNTTSTRRANAIAFDVREKGRPMREGNSITGKIVKDENGNTVNIPGTLKGTKAIGWYIDEYGIAQVSMNITNTNETPLHIAFEEVTEKAAKRGIRVTGLEIVGLAPRKTLLDAADYYLTKQQRSLGVDEKEKMKIAIKSMGLDDLKPFDPEEKVIEYLIEKENATGKLIDMTCEAFANETASESPAPGGGSISAYMGALGAALATMVANLSAHKPGWDDRWEEFSRWAEKGQRIKDDLLYLVDEDTNSFNKIMAAFGLPKSTDEEKNARSEAIQEATKYATEIPFKTMQRSFEVFELCEAMIEKGNPNSVSDAGVGALCAKAAVTGAYLNVKINAADLKDRVFAAQITGAAKDLVEKANVLEKELLRRVEEVIG
ncbi:glutamate formimidoyltransferase [Bacteroidales bacterium OttesenSCG-928-B11]|nr:glutamate formimidoyltransferase [Bacteroidales bacterium OttesenSCG-928-E04]MDL2312301.1 glutamate formimidoyltransferase [Bacteroidales bacterium OttesenSCG-928-B11]MDL2326002.1 glutamate formimidoyltransferase [Bacteroidales bacterium OttesenSCG-928-A14]